MKKIIIILGLYIASCNYVQIEQKDYPVSVCENEYRVVTKVYFCKCLLIPTTMEMWEVDDVEKERVDSMKRVRMIQALKIKNRIEECIKNK